MSRGRAVTGGSGLPAVVRLRHPMAVISFLDGVGAPVERRLRESGLPAYFLDPDALVPLTRVWRFFDRASRLDVPSVGWRAFGSLGKPNLDDGLMSKLERTPTLYGALHQFQRLVARESSQIRLGMWERTRDILFYMHHPDRAEACGYLQAQLYQLRVVLSLVRHFVGSRWQPRVLGLQGDQVPRILEEDLPNCRILSGQPVGFLAIDRHHLAASLRHWSPERSEAGGLATSPISNEAEALRVLLRSYLSEGYPTVRFAAGLLGTSPRRTSCGSRPR